MMKKQIIRCPYCGSPAILRDTSYVHGKNAWEGKLYVCSRYPVCNSYVSVHPGTTRPKGTLANKSLRKKRIRAHRIFDQIWKQGILSKKMPTGGCQTNSASTPHRHISVISVSTCANDL